MGEEAEGLNQEIQTLEREIDASMKAAQLEHRRKRFAQDLTDNITVRAIYVLTLLMLLLLEEQLFVVVLQKLEL